MSAQEQSKNHAALDWSAQGVPVSPRFEDPYFSFEDGLAESRHVFLEGNGLPERLRPGFHIAELGFGTGLNMLATWRAAQESGVSGDVLFTSFEAYPLEAAQIDRALALFPELAPLRALFIPAWAQTSGALREIYLPGMVLRVVIGDARETLPRWDGRADAWFLDGFSPAKNPELWDEGLMMQIAAHSQNGATCATYSAAGHVRRALSAAGFSITRRPGFARKRHMSAGHFSGPPVPSNSHL